MEEVVVQFGCKLRVGCRGWFCWGCFLGCCKAHSRLWPRSLLTVSYLSIMNEAKSFIHLDLN